ncbi:HepT-like ribonuclease domain-containing protein [Hymenobacter cavernae]|uniref:DUF86 domain-containing protein n=1 Tax=Hymenobacter cavernae TaxID=2044852 RepID=A0ABQ1UD90_9BACT|nr:HepT-like ribonuclease domain-containing protein [Hymenobacter cavernae]GGF13840.1 hypothetical protein GCM10011383_26370 [Hymenobacter cavernae]
MTQHGRKYLFDILRAIELAEEFVRDLPSFAAYQVDAKTRSAVERQLGIVGEAVNHLRRVWPEAELPNTKQMVDFRNRLIHSYDNIDDAVVWTILKKHLPILKADVQRRLASEEE